MVRTWGIVLPSRGMDKMSGFNVLTRKCISRNLNTINFEAVLRGRGANDLLVEGVTLGGRVG